MPPGIHIEPYFTQRFKHIICDRSHKSIREETQKSDCSRKQPTNKKPVQSPRNRKKPQQNVARGSL
jgi:hypothetical protein